MAFIFAILFLPFNLAQVTQFVNPDFFFDFSQAISSTTAQFVVDQVTNNPMNAFTFDTARSSACPGAGLSQPTQGPDGLNFNQEKQSVRLQYADNIDLQPRSMIAMWVKSFAGVPTPRNETLLTQARYDNRNETPHQFSIGLMSNPLAPAKLGMRFSTFLFNTTTNAYQYVEFYYQNKLDIADGWVLLVVGIDNVAVPGQTSITFKMRSNSATLKDYWTFTTPLNWVQRAQDKQDIYLGAFCDLFNAAAVYGNPFRGTISRLWIWRNIQLDGLMGDFLLDRYFFRITNPSAQPICMDSSVTGTVPGNIPCRFCVVGFNPPVGFSEPTTLTCLSQDKTLQQMYIAYWNFDDLAVTQYIDDKSGNGYYLYRGTPSDIAPNQPMRISNQGILFEMNMFASGNLPILLHNYPQFTWDIWIRRESPNPASATGNIAFAFLQDRTSGGTYQLDFGIQISDVNQRVLVTMGNVVQSSPSYTTVLRDGTWNYFAVSIYRWNVGSVRGCRIRFMSNLDGLNSAINCASFVPYTVSSQSALSVVSYRNYIFNRMRIFQYAMSIDELPAMVKTGATNCIKKLGQNQCTICPEDGNCLTMCNQNQFEDPVSQTCNACRWTCGNCWDYGLQSCNYCTRVQPSLIYYSVPFGNCTCKSGYYYNSTNDACEQCNSQCSECFGPSNTQCLTCAPGQIFYPPTYCVATCSDPLVMGDGQFGYFMATETIAGAGSFNMCIKCHPYCTNCYGTQNGECTGCQDGYFLTGTQCINNCSAFFYPDMVVKACSPCDPSCIACTGPQFNKCTVCYQPPDGSGVPGNVIKKYLQTGVCKNQCDAGYYPDQQQTCQVCHPACATCTSSRNTTCGSCNSGYFLEWLGFSCGFGCVDGKYGDAATNMCLLCHYSCKTCKGAGPDQCTVCADSYYRRKSLCVSQCAPGEFVVDGACFSCNFKCLTCFGPNDDECYTCADNVVTGLGYYNYGTTCTSACPDGYYPDNFKKICKLCKTICSKCTSIDFCTECIDGPYQLNNGECTFFQCMTTQYLAVTPNLACYDCDPSCLTCQGMSKFDCLTCPPSNKYIDQQCIPCDDQPGMTTSPNPNYVGCIEICGDGFNFGMVECDDGNLMDGDGCDSKCFIEKGWNCTGGSILMPDTCFDIQEPTPKISLINNQNQIYISFDEEVVLMEDVSSKSDPKFTISITGNQPSYKFEWEIYPPLNVGSHMQSFIISLTMYQSLKGNEVVTVKFVNSHTFQDNAGNGIIMFPMVGFLSAFKYNDPFWTSFFGGISSYIIFGVGAVAFANIIAGSFWGASTTCLWTVISYLQMVTMVPLMTVNWPDFITNFFGDMGQTFNGEFDMVPNSIFKMIAGSATQLEYPLNTRFKDYNYNYSNFFYLSGKKLLLWLGLLGSYPIIWYLKRNYADKHKFCKLWEILEQKFRYNILLRGLLLSYLSFVMAATLNVYKMEFINLTTTISCFTSIAFQIIMIYMPIHFMNILQKSYDRLNQPKFLAQFSNIIDELDLTHPSKYMFYAVFLIRRIIFVFLLVLFTNSYLLCIATQCAASLFFIFYILIAKPFLRRITTVLTIIGEVFLMGLFAIGVALTNPDQSDAQNQQYGFLIVLLLGLLMVIGFICMTVQVTQDILATCRERAKKGDDKRQKEDEEFRYKKWKKRRQLVKREHALKDKQKLLDQHEDLVNKFRIQQEEEEERREREEEERERLENGGDENNEYGNEYGSPYGDYSKGWQEDQSQYMMNGYDNSYLIEQQMRTAEKKVKKSPYGGGEDTQYQTPGGKHRAQDGPESAVSRHRPTAAELLQLNKNSGSIEQFQEQQEYEYGAEEYGGYGEEYYPEQQPLEELQNATPPKPEKTSKRQKSKPAPVVQVVEDEGEAAQEEGVFEGHTEEAKIEDQNPMGEMDNDQWGSVPFENVETPPNQKKNSKNGKKQQDDEWN